MPKPLSWVTLRDRWQGVALTLVIGATTLWLGATGQLILYIHPRYVVFTVILVAIGTALALLALAVDPVDDGHEPDRGYPGTRSRILGTAALAVTSLVCVALVVLPPAALSSATASTRDVGASTLSLGTTTAGPGTTADTAATAKYTVLDWATRLRQSSSLGDYAGKTVDVTGFIAPSTTDPDYSFVVTRFVITCCAVDAQPVGLTVYDPSWHQNLAKDDWVTIRGGFAANPDGGASPIAIVPTTVRKVAQPHDPYLY